MTESYNYEAIAKMIDHSLLNPSLTTREFEQGCLLAVRYEVASVCILPYYLARCAELLAGTTVNASTTIGFPHGGHTTAIKLAEVRQALKDGGQELDAVINISKARSGDWQYVRNELEALTYAVHEGGAKIKVIFENAYLDDAAKIRLCEICGGDWRRLGEDFNWLCAQRSHPAGFGTDAQTLPGAGSGKGGGRHPRSRFPAGCARDRREPGGGDADRTMLEDCRKRLGLEPITQTVPAAAVSAY